jgi:competence protein ComEC
MEKGSEWILFVAHWVAGWEGSVTAIPTPPAAALPLVTVAGFWFILWRWPVRWLAVVPALAALAVWTWAERPVMIVSEDGGLVGLMGPEGRALSAERGAGFAARNWLENDGDLAPQEEAARRPGFSGPPEARSFTVAGLRGVVLKGKGSEDRVAKACAGADLVIVAARVETPPAGCRVLDEGLLAQTGAIAFREGPGGLHPQISRGGGRRWSAPGPEVAPAPIDPSLPAARGEAQDGLAEGCGLGCSPSTGGPVQAPGAPAKPIGKLRLSSAQAARQKPLLPRRRAPRSRVLLQ